MALERAGELNNDRGVRNKLDPACEFFIFAVRFGR